MTPGTIYTVISLIIAISLTSSCKDKAPEQKKERGLPSATAFDLDNRLKEADSLVVIFYKDPYGEDSLRYTRYYTQTSVTDAGEINILLQELGQTFKGQEKRRNCRGEGKIWCFAKGKVFQTLYFSTRCDDCCYLYLVKDGNFYYSRISSSMTSWLEKLKPLSAEPTAGLSEISQ
jgi:hypothetical protein